MAHSDIVDLEDNPLAKGRNGNIIIEKDGNSFVSSSIGNNEMKFPVKNTLSATNGKGTINNRMAESPARNIRSSVKKRRNMKHDRLDNFFKPDMLESSKLGICLCEEKRKLFESNMRSKKSTFLEVSSDVSGTSQISTKDNRACSDNFGNEVDSRKVIGKIVSLSSSNEGGLKEK